VKSMYIVINKFSVKSKHYKDFVKETKIVWFRSYRKSRGFIDSMLLKNRQNPCEILTVDIWKSKRFADNFFSKNLQQLLKVSTAPKRYVWRKSYDTRD